jgi:CheY-like chemotaxis protein
MKQILLVDDDERLLLTTRAFLEREGYSVTITSSPFGVSKLARSLQPNLILIDVNMPGLSGDGLAEVLSRNDQVSSIPVLFYSSNDAESLREKAARLRVAGYVCKGDLRELATKVRAHAR